MIQIPLVATTNIFDNKRNSSQPVPAFASAGPD